MDKLLGTEWMERQVCKGVRRMVNPKDVPSGQGKEDNRKTGNCRRIGRVYITAKAC